MFHNVSVRKIGKLSTKAATPLYSLRHDFHPMLMNITMMKLEKHYLDCGVSKCPLPFFASGRSKFNTFVTIIKMHLVGNDESHSSSGGETQFGFHSTKRNMQEIWQ